MNRKATVLVGLLGCGGSTPRSEPISRNVEPPRSTVKAPRKPAEAMFGHFVSADDRRFMRVTEFKRSLGLTFGWKIRLPCHGPVEYTETMHLPAPGDWKSLFERRKKDPRALRSTTISEDGTQTVTHEYAACVDGWIEHVWALEPNDPVGMWTVEVAIPSYAPVNWTVRLHD